MSWLTPKGFTDLQIYGFTDLAYTTAPVATYDLQLTTKRHFQLNCGALFIR
jgi:hypothetical protein